VKETTLVRIVENFLRQMLLKELAIVHLFLYGASGYQPKD